MIIESGRVYKLEGSIYQYVIDVTGGAVTMQISGDKGTTFQTMTDGSIAATGDGVFYVAQDMQFKATVPAGSTMYIGKVTDER